jgi:hypothetical protein
MPNPQIPTTYLSLTSLGSQRGYYPVRKIYRLGSLILFILFLAGSAFFVVSGIYETILATRLHGPAMIDDKLADPLVFASILLMAGSLAGWNTYNLWNKGVMVFETGFTWRDRKGIQVWRWEELVSITSAITRHYTIGIYTGTTRVYTLYLRRHQCLRLSDCFSRVEQLAQELDRNTFPLLYGSSAECYNAGQTVTFGPLAINTEGMVIGRISLDTSERGFHPPWVSENLRERGRRVRWSQCASCDHPQCTRTFGNHPPDCRAEGGIET